MFSIEGMDVRADADRLAHRKNLGSLQIHSDLACLGEVRRFIEQVSSEVGLSTERAYDLKVAVSEACANAVEYGRPDDKIDLIACLNDNNQVLVLDVASRGDFRVGVHTDSERRHRGLGVPLMVALSDEVRVSRSQEGTTTVSLVLFLDQHEAA